MRCLQNLGQILCSKGEHRHSSSAHSESHGAIVLSACAGCRCRTSQCALVLCISFGTFMWLVWIEGGIQSCAVRWVCVQRGSLGTPRSPPPAHIDIVGLPKIFLVSAASTCALILYIING